MRGPLLLGLFSDMLPTALIMQHRMGKTSLGCSLVSQLHK